MLEYNINRSIGKEWFSTKVLNKIKDKRGYVGSKYPFANYLVKKYKNNPKPYWTKDDIEDSTKEVCDRITKFIFND